MTEKIENFPTTLDDEAQGVESVAAYILRIGERVRGLKAQRGMTRKELAKHSGISERYLAQLEAGKANISISLLWRIAEAMNVGLGELLSGDTRSAIHLEPLRKFLEQLSLSQERAAYELLLKYFSDSGRSLRGVALIGLRGAGKTTVGNLLANEFKIPFVKLRDVIEKLGGLEVSELFSLGGQKAYRRLEYQAVDHVLENYDNVILEAGGSLVSQKETYNHLLASFYTVWVRATPEEHMTRVAEQGDLRPMKGNKEAMEDLKRILEEREPYYKAANYVLNTSGRSVEECVQELVDKCHRSNRFSV